MPLCFPIWAPLWTRALHPRRAVLPLSQAATRVTSRPCQPNSSSGNRRDPAGQERCYDVGCSQHTHTNNSVHRYTHQFICRFIGCFLLLCSVIGIFFFSLSLPLTLPSHFVSWIPIAELLDVSIVCSSCLKSFHPVMHTWCCFVLFVKGECPYLPWPLLLSSQVSVISFSDCSWNVFSSLYICLYRTPLVNNSSTETVFQSSFVIAKWCTIHCSLILCIWVAVSFSMFSFYLSTTSQNKLSNIPHFL